MYKSWLSKRWIIRRDQQSSEPALILIVDVVIPHLPSRGAVIVDIDLRDSRAVATLAESACPVDVAPVNGARVLRPPQLAAVVVRVADVDDFFPTAHVDWAALVALK
jgi:hypothetical protein